MTILYQKYDEVIKQLKSDCSKCSGLCCVALFFSKIDGFPENKIAGKACSHLMTDYCCNIHCQLTKQKMKGCIGYDCFGAGQHVTQSVYQGKTWNDLFEQSAEIFDVFTVVFQLHQIRYFLIESMLFSIVKPLEKEIHTLYVENIKICHSSIKEILSFDLEKYKTTVNLVLKQLCNLLLRNTNNKESSIEFFGKSFKGKNMSGINLSSKLLIAANFEDCLFNGTIFLGADTRDTNFSNANLSESIFLTQGQINSAKGNRNTKLPKHLDYPITWK